MFEKAETLGPQLAEVRSILEESSGREMSGAEIGSLLQNRLPSFDIRAATGVVAGSGALSILLRDHFPDLVQVVGKKGGDNLYWIGPPVVEGQLRKKNKSVNLWTAFASPSLGLRLAVDRNNGTLSTCQVSAELEANLISFPSITLAELTAMAEEFSGNLSPNVSEELRCFAEVGNFSASWFKALQSLDEDAAKRWARFRIDRIIDRFRARLEDVSLPSEHVESCTQELVRAQREAYNLRYLERSKKSDQPIVNVSDRGERSAESPNDPLRSEDVRRLTGSNSLNVVFARNIACQTIATMSLTDIRKLRLPLGAIIDAGLLGR